MNPLNPLSLSPRSRLRLSAKQLDWPGWNGDWKQAVMLSVDMYPTAAIGESAVRTCRRLPASWLPGGMFSLFASAQLLQPTGVWRSDGLDISKTGDAEAAAGRQ